MRTRGKASNQVLRGLRQARRGGLYFEYCVAAAAVAIGMIAGLGWLAEDVSESYRTLACRVLLEVGGPAAGCTESARTGRTGVFGRTAENRSITRVPTRTPAGLEGLDVAGLTPAQVAELADLASEYNPRTLAMIAGTMRGRNATHGKRSSELGVQLAGAGVNTGLTLSRSEARQVQLLLRAAGAYNGSIDGRAGDGTKAGLAAVLPGTEWSGWSADQLITRLTEAVTQHLREHANPGSLIEPLAEANSRLSDWIAARHRRLSYPLALGPTLDGTYFYRLGEAGTHGFGMAPAELENAERALTGQGFPTLVEPELALVNATSYTARRLARPDIPLVVKHFPGGGPRLELTEKIPVAFESVAEVKQSLHRFRQLLESPAPPAMIMLSHATYPAAAFEGMSDTITVGPLKGMPVDQVPASMNPEIVSYLRETLGFQGLIVGDWYSGMKAAERFAESFHYGAQEAPTVDLPSDLKKLVFAVIAGVDYVPELHPHFTLMADRSLARHDPEVMPLFRRKVDEAVLRIWRTLDPSVSESDLKSRLSTTEKLVIVTDDTRHAHQPWAKAHYKEKYEDLHGNFQMYRETEPGLMSKFHKNGMGLYDIWNRTGVMTLLQRQMVYESFIGAAAKVVAPPRNTNDEERWFTELTSDPGFVAFQAAVDWDSAEMAALFETALERRLVTAN